MFAECGTRLAVKILGDIAQGRGSAVAHDVVTTIMLHLSIRFYVYNVF